MFGRLLLTVGIMSLFRGIVVIKQFTLAEFVGGMKNIMKKRKKKSKKKLSAFHRTIDSDSIYSDLSKLHMSLCMTTNMTYLSYEGKLLKYTNIMKGWQFRWFILDPKTGVLSYFISESDRWNRPKGWTTLASAVISPSDEDCNSFTVNSIFGCCLRLRARDSKCRQEWIDRLMAVAQLHGGRTHSYSQSESSTDKAWDALAPIKERLFNAEQSRLELAKAIEDLPSQGRLQHQDPDLLTLKALSYAVVVSLNDCLGVLSQNISGNRIDSFSSNIDNSGL